MDLDSIEPGLDFVEVIERAVASCAVLVVLIGRQWATVTDEGGSGDWMIRTTSSGPRCKPRWSVGCG
jgi:hypothetical protein